MNEKPAKYDGRPKLVQDLREQSPPHNEEAESALLGAVLIANVWLAKSRAAFSLAPQHFYRPRHRVIFAAMIEMEARSEPIDVVTLTAWLDKSDRLVDAGGADYIGSITSFIPAIGNTLSYAKIVRDTSRRRDVLSAARNLEEAALSDPEDLAKVIDSSLAVIENAHPVDAGSSRRITFTQRTTWSSSGAPTR